MWAFAGELGMTLLRPLAWVIAAGAGFLGYKLWPGERKEDWQFSSLIAIIAVALIVFMFMRKAK